MSDLDDMLEEFRKRARQSDLAPLVDDPVAVRFMASWRNVPTAWRKPKSKPPEETNRLWWWLWRGVSWDRRGVARAARMSESTAASYANSCATARAIFPDGTLSKHAEELLSAHAESRFPGKSPPKKRRGRPPKPKES